VEEVSMKAKEVAESLRRLKLDGLTPEQVIAVQADEFVEKAWDEFKRVIELRFGVGGKRITISDLRGLIIEYSDWGTCVARRAKLPWLKDGCGRVVFGIFLDAVAKVSGGMISVSDLSMPNLTTVSNRMRPHPVQVSTTVETSVPSEMAE
jgi:hypothetical protein